jgi:hypothetical protein
MIFQKSHQISAPAYLLYHWSIFSQCTFLVGFRNFILNVLHKKTAKNCENPQRSYKMMFWFYDLQKIFISGHYPFKNRSIVWLPWLYFNLPVELLCNFSFFQGYFDGQAEKVNLSRKYPNLGLFYYIHFYFLWCKRHNVKYYAKTLLKELSMLMQKNSTSCTLPISLTTLLI